MLRERSANPGISRICWAIGILAVAAAVLLAPPGAFGKGAAPGGDDCERLDWPAIAAAATTPNIDPAGAAGATLAFLPGPVRSPQPLLLRDLESLPGFALGLTSPTLGRYSPAQELLDVSQGSRVASGLYKPVAPPVPGFAVDRATGAGRIVGWEGFVARAEDVPGEVVPGLLAATLAQAGQPITYVGYDGGSNGPAIAAARNHCGVVEHTTLGPQSTLAARASAASATAGMTVVSLPPGGQGIGIVKQLARENPKRLLIVMQAPPDPARNRLLPIAIHGLGGDGGMKSPTTRRAGLVAATDVAPTVLDRLGIDRPRRMEGRPIEPAGRMDAAELMAMSDRLTLINSRRAPFGKGAVFMLALILLGVLALARLTGHFAEQSRLALRLVALAMLWLPAMLLVTAALRPTGSAELNIVVAGGLLLSLITDRVARWPRAPVVPVAVALVAYGVDLSLGGSNLTGQSLLGSNPFYGARFFGAGNELEATFVVATLIAVGALLCWHEFKRPAWVFGITGVGLAMYLGAGLLGADVGGVIMVAAGFGVAALHASRQRLTLKTAALLVFLPIAGLAAVVLIDHLTGGQAHLTRTVVHAESAGDLLDVGVRRLRASVDSAMIDRVWVLVLLAGAALGWAWWRRDRLLAPLGDGPARERYRGFESALAGGLAATLVGTVANDSGPAILLIGTIYLSVGVLYVRGRPSP